MLRSIVKALYVRLWVLPRIHRNYGAMSVADAFRNIYQTNAWGSNGGKFYSGSGSHGTACDLYCIFASKFILDHKVKTVVDLGCGDFAVGKRIVEATDVFYTGIDVVPELIRHHKETVHDPRVSFQCLDIRLDPLPPADLYLTRQVLQHLSNGEISQVLANIMESGPVLVSEDVPLAPKSFNRDKPHGPDVRSYYGSGVYVDQPPFTVSVKQTWEIPLTDQSLLRTVLVDELGSLTGNSNSADKPKIE